MKKKVLYCLLGASGSGKTTLAKHLKEIGMSELVSHTTRAPRKKDNEVHGVHYYFVTDEEFDKIEKIEESPYSGKHRYCISAEEMNSKFKKSDRLFVIVDLCGAKQVKENCKNRNVDVKIIYIKTDLNTMKVRMETRGDKLEDIQERLSYAKESNELENGQFADYVVDNRGDLESSIAQLEYVVKYDKDKGFL